MASLEGWPLGGRRPSRAAELVIGPATSGRTSWRPPQGDGKNQKLIARLSTASAASLIASVSVGWAWQVRAISSDEAPNSIATAASPIILPASGPRICTPSTRPVLALARILTKPSVVRLTRARALALNGNLPAL